MREVAVSLGARVHLAHACVQVLADRIGADLVHVKGPALHPRLRHEQRTDGTDADVVVRPAHVEALTAALAAHGWRLVTGFETGSVFAHAANYHHLHYGYVDVHRWVPGIAADPAEAFDLVWNERVTSPLAGIECAVPALVDQALLLLLHAARGQGSLASVEDHQAAWERLDDPTRLEIRARAERLRATVGLAAALGELDEHPPDRTIALWRFYSRGGTRLEEHLAVLRAAPTLRARARVLARGVRLNQEYAAMALGHAPSPVELRRLRRQRWGRALGAVRHRLARRWGRGRGR